MLRLNPLPAKTPLKERVTAWFARHGYICLIIDTLQLGEIEGIHHGTYRYDRWVVGVEGNHDRLFFLVL